MAEILKGATVLRSEEDFGGEPDVLLGSTSGKKKKKKKKQNAMLKPFEKMVFDQAKRFDKATKEYRDRHEKSNKKKKNGWIRDLPNNSTKSLNKIMKF